MIARHDGLVLLVAGAIPGEPARVRVDRVERSLAYASVEQVLEPHPARRGVTIDPRSGGAVYAHIAYPEQRRLKGEIIADALRRLARIEPPADIDVTASPELGYRMRARVHVRDHRIGFFLEQTHQICDVRDSGQLLPETATTLDQLAAALGGAGLAGGAEIEVSENRSADQRALHIELLQGARLVQASRLGPLPGVTGLSWSPHGSSADRVAFGTPFVDDVLDQVGDPPGAVPGGVRLRRHVKAFFQGNRFLLDQLVGAVLGACPAGPVLELYSGAGLFGVSLAATGRHRVIVVEGHPASASDLRVNAEPYGEAIDVHHTSVERFVEEAPRHQRGTLVLDPPRSGMSREAMTGILGLGADRVVLVSCDVATFARDVRRFVDKGYRLTTIRGFDLFPTTAHVEVFAVLDR